MTSFPARQDGSTLLESLIAILVFSFGVLGMVGLQAASIKSISEAKYRTDAAFLANELIGQMWAERATITIDYTAPDDWADRVANTLPGGTGSVAVSARPALPKTVSTSGKLRMMRSCI